MRPRDKSRLLVLNRETGAIEHLRFTELPTFLETNDLLVLNNSRVFRARLFGRKSPGGGKVEILLLSQRDSMVWEAMVGGSGLHPNKTIALEGGIQAQIIADLGGTRRLIAFEQPLMETLGELPLPPYITEPIRDESDYQTVFAEQLGSSAAPTAGLHFTDSLLDKIRVQGTAVEFITLHIGLDTFAPVHQPDPHDHQIHSEWCRVSDRLSSTLNHRRSAGGRVLAVGTTTVRSLETAAAQDGTVSPYEGATVLYILPGYEFRVIDGLVTNFHLPKSTLLMMVSAFAGPEHIMEAYRQAIEQRYRFYSFGDAMLII